MNGEGQKADATPFWRTVRGVRTSIEIGDELLREAQRLTGARTKRETVDVALRELVARRRRAAILDLRGHVRWEGSLEESRAAHP